MSQFFEELKRRKVVRVGIAYLVAAWVLLQVTDVVAPILELPVWMARVVLYVLTGGFFLCLILAWAFELTSGGIKRDRGDRSGAESRASTGQKIEHGVIGILAMALLGIGIFWYQGKDDRWARDVAFPQIEQYAAEGRWEEAYNIAKEVEAVLSEDPKLDVLWATFTWITSIPSNPPGAMVSRQPYGDPHADWEQLGTTPLHDIRIPQGLSLLRIELDGHPSLLRVIGGESGGFGNLPVEEKPSVAGNQIPPGAHDFDTQESLPAGMVRVPGVDIVLNGEQAELRFFYIDRHEVTNRQFKEFVDAGGYQRRDLWEYEFLLDGEVISWDQGIARFIDRTGRPGPYTWEAGSYPDGDEDHPVAGVSWYEAAAYARFVGRELPTVHHWRRAFAGGMLTWIVPASNLESDGTVPVGQSQGVSWTGAYDMAGNVREWCMNSIGDQRVILGGSWNDPLYMVQETIYDPGSLPAFNRSPTNGFRLAESGDERSVTQRLRDPVPEPEEIVIADPVSDEVFAAYLNGFDYDPGPLNPIPEETQISRFWTRERISISAGSGDERIALYLYLPNSGRSRYQTIVYWPTHIPLLLDTVDQINVQLDFVLKNGRAVVLPVMDGTFERRRPGYPDWGTIAGRDLVIQQIKDMRRSIDYLESRSDIESEALGFFGWSWGGRLGAIALAVEPRLKVGILNQAGVQHLKMPETSVLNYLPRVDVPVLQFNGLYDTDFRFETSAKPFFDLLGTSEKKHVVEPTGHFVSQATVIGETLNWLDKYLGPVAP